MSDWKESAIKRRDFRNMKSDPQVPKQKQSKNKGKFTHKLIIEGFRFWISDTGKDYVFSKYRSKEAAEEAMKQKSADGFWGKYKMKIEEIK